MAGSLLLLAGLSLAGCAEEGDATVVSGPYSNTNASNREPFSSGSLPAGANSSGYDNRGSGNFGTLGVVRRY